MFLAPPPYKNKPQHQCIYSYIPNILWSYSDLPNDNHKHNPEKSKHTKKNITYKNTSQYIPLPTPIYFYMYVSPLITTTLNILKYKPFPIHTNSYPNIPTELMCSRPGKIQPSKMGFLFSL